MSGVIGMPAPAGLVHGMGKELTLPDWSPLTSAEVHTVLARYPRAPGDEMITWRSPRPMSAAGLIRHGGADLFGFQRAIEVAVLEARSGVPARIAQRLGAHKEH